MTDPLAPADGFKVDRISGPPFRQLEIFHAVMTAHSVSAAARLLNVSQPSLSRSLMRLEDQMKVRLFQRFNRRLVPTAEAVRLFTEVDGVMHQINALSSSIARIAEGQSTLFRFGATQSLTRALVPIAIRTMTREASSLQVFLDTPLRVQHIDYLLSGQGECIVTLAQVRHPLLDVRVIGEAPLVCLVPRDHPLAHRPHLAARDLAGFDIIGFENSGPHSEAINLFLADRTGQQNVRAYVRFPEAAITLAAEGVGLALVDDFSAHGMLSDKLVRRPLAAAPMFTARLYWSRERSNSRYVEKLGDALVAAMPSLSQ